ncbi:probable glutamate receptor [Chelonus insularis]|uniref:probable glutamate receptor n=1 Tax=Chelonus insularis TaxID=460826 RepID=UPI00158AEF93|nr:probable glutamate receptor [Chelonus insularis]
MVSRKNNTSQYSETILEIFKVNRNSKLFHNIFVTWDPKNDIEFPTNNLNGRRNQLYGLNLRTAIMHTLPSMSISYTNNGQIHVGGIFGEVIDILKVVMNFTMTYIITEQYGNFEENKWTGAVGLLVRNESDFFPGYLGMTSSRLGAIDYTKPLFLSNDRFFYSKPPPSLKWNQFLKPFNHDIWLAIMLSILLFGVVITYLEFIYQYKNRTSVIRTIFIKIMINLMFVFSAFCGKNGVRSKIDSIAIVQYVIHLAVVVLSAAYSGILISSLTTNSDMPDFKTMKNFNDNSKYTMGLRRGSTYLHLFRNSTDEIMRKMVEKTITNNGLTSSNAEGFEKACSDHTYAFYTTDIAKNYYNPNDCVLLASESIMRLSISFGLQYNSPFKDLMNHYIMWLRTSGIMNRILNNWAEYKYQQSESNLKPVGLIDVAAIAIYFIIAAIGSIIILWGEKIFYKKRRQRKFATVFNRLITNNKYPMDNNCIVPIK